ncbi:carbohydrate ABC transporter permease [Falsiroseomonas sp.]|uniref:carbohydrate ABC transporter permease n=1 Tax=Falsiroseomonas sp. TaxID=2870721 RepID=UPI0034A37A29
MNAEAPAITLAAPRHVAPARRDAKPPREFGAHLMLALLSLLSVFPIYWMLVSALRADNDIFSTDLWPAAPSLDNFAYVIESIPIGGMILTTFMVAAVSTVLQLVTGLLAAYAFARWRFAIGRVLFALLTVTWLIPAQVIMVPNFVLVSALGLLDTPGALIIPHAASAFAIMILYQAIRSFPEELIDAARMDGGGHMTVLWRVMVPNMRPALASLGILLFISSWNEYFWPLLVTRSVENAVVQIGLQMFMTQEGDQWGPLMAAASLVSLPVLALYLVLQRQIIDSFVKSGIR